MNLVKDYDTSLLSSIKLGSIADYYLETDDPSQVVEAVKFAKSKQLNYRIIADGNNSVIIGDGQRYVGVVVRFTHNSLELNNNHIIAAAGSNWDQVVKLACSHGLSGIEALSLIPGSVGGALVQNIGAYGQNLAQTLQSVKAINLEGYREVTFSKDDCQFGYRSSIFKNTNQQKYLIVKVELALSPKPTMTRETLYKGLPKILEGKDLTPDNIRQAVIDTRLQKFGTLEENPSCGSFFKNPIVDQSWANQLKRQYQNLLDQGYIIYDPTDDGLLKVRLAFIFDKILGLKGYQKYGFELSAENPLIVINRGGNYQGLMKLVDDLRARFDADPALRQIELVAEPDLIK